MAFPANRNSRHQDIARPSGCLRSMTGLALRQLVCSMVKTGLRHPGMCRCHARNRPLRHVLPCGAGTSGPSHALRLMTHHTGGFFKHGCGGRTGIQELTRIQMNVRANGRFGFAGACQLEGRRVLIRHRHGRARAHESIKLPQGGEHLIHRAVRYFAIGHGRIKAHFMTGAAILLKSHGLKGGLVLGAAVTVLTGDLHFPVRTVDSLDVEVNIMWKLQCTGALKGGCGWQPDANELRGILGMGDLDSELGMVFHEVSNIVRLCLSKAGTDVLVTCGTLLLGEHRVLLRQPEFAPMIAMTTGATQTVWSRGRIGPMPRGL